MTITKEEIDKGGREDRVDRVEENNNVIFEEIEATEINKAIEENSIEITTEREGEEIITKMGKPQEEDLGEVSEVEIEEDSEAETEEGIEEDLEVVIEEDSEVVIEEGIEEGIGVETIEEIKMIGMGEMEGKGEMPEMDKMLVMVEI